MTKPQGRYIGRTIGLTPQQDSELKKLAKKEKLSVSEFVRNWVEGQRTKGAKR